MEWAVLPLRRYAEFSGRSRRLELWSFTAAVSALWLIAAMLALGTGAAQLDDPAEVGTIAMAGMLAGVFGVLLFVPAMAVQVRRLHDLNLSGWFVLLDLIPYAGWLAMTVLMLLPGTKGDNRFGPDPKAASFAERSFG